MISHRSLAGRPAVVQAGTFALLMSVVLAPADAGAQQWTQLGASGGRIQQLAVAPTDPAIVYAGAYLGGLYRSTDAGSTWSRVAIAEIGRDTVDALAFAPGGSSVVYAGTESKGIFKSTDGGLHWTAINTGVPSSNSRLMSVDAIAVDPANPAVVLAGGVAFFSAGTPAIVRSTNGGQSWAPVTAPGLVDVDIYDLAIAGGAAFAATDREGVWWSHDGGVTWEHLGGDAIDNISVKSVAVDESEAALRVIAATNDGIWTVDVAVAPPAPLRTLRAAVPIGDWAKSYVEDIVYTVYMVETCVSYAYGGAEPEPTPAPLQARQAAAEPVYYMSTITSGVFRSADRSATDWQHVSDGLDPVDIDALDVAASDPYTLYAGADGAGVWRSFDAGESWGQASRGLNAATIAAVAVDPASPATVYAGSEGGGVLKSVDGGVTFGAVGFESMIHNAFDPWVAALVVDPNVTSNLYAVTGEGFFRSTNGGATWSRVPLPGNTYARTLIAGPGAPTTLWLGGSPGVLRSTDGGLTWTRPDPAFNQGVTAIAIARTAPLTMYAGTMSNGVWKTTNGGTSWTHVNNDGGSGFLTYGTVPAIAVDHTSADIAYACVDRHALYKTTNGGTSWENLTEGLFDSGAFAYAMLTSIIINPADPKTLFAGSAGSSYTGATFFGVYRSNDGGAHWAKFGSGLEDLPVRSLIFDPTNKNRLYAGTAGGGVFRYGAAATRTHPVRSSPRKPVATRRRASLSEARERLAVGGNLDPALVRAAVGVDRLHRVGARRHPDGQRIAVQRHPLAAVGVVPRRYRDSGAARRRHPHAPRRRRARGGQHLQAAGRRQRDPCPGRGHSERDQRGAAPAYQRGVTAGRQRRHDRPASAVAARPDAVEHPPTGRRRDQDAVGRRAVRLGDEQLEPLLAGQ